MLRIRPETHWKKDSKPRLNKAVVNWPIFECSVPGYNSSLSSWHFRLNVVLTCSITAVWKCPSGYLQGYIFSCKLGSWSSITACWMIPASTWSTSEVMPWPEPSAPFEWIGPAFQHVTPDIGKKWHGDHVPSNFWYDWYSRSLPHKKENLNSTRSELPEEWPCFSQTNQHRTMPLLSPRLHPRSNPHNSSKLSKSPSAKPQCGQSHQAQRRPSRFLLVRIFVVQSVLCFSMFFFHVRFTPRISWVLPPSSCKEHVAQIEDVSKHWLGRWRCQRGIYAEVGTNHGTKDLHFNGNPKHLGLKAQGFNQNMTTNINAWSLNTTLDWKQSIKI